MKDIYTLKLAAELWGVNLPTLTKHAKGDRSTVPLFFYSEANSDSGTWLVTKAGMDRLYKNNLRDSLPTLELDKIKLGLTAGQVVRNNLGEKVASERANYALNYILEQAHNSARDALLDIIDISKPWGRLVMRDDLVLTAFVGGLGESPMARRLLGMKNGEE